MTGVVVGAEVGAVVAAAGLVVVVFATVVVGEVVVVGARVVVVVGEVVVVGSEVVGRADVEVVAGAVVVATAATGSSEEDPPLLGQLSATIRPTKVKTAAIAIAAGAYQLRL